MTLNVISSFGSPYRRIWICSVLSNTKSRTASLAMWWPRVRDSGDGGFDPVADRVDDRLGPSGQQALLAEPGQLVFLDRPLLFEQLLLFALLRGVVVQRFLLLVLRIFVLEVFFHGLEGILHRLADPVDPPLGFLRRRELLEDLCRIHEGDARDILASLPDGTRSSM